MPLSKIQSDILRLLSSRRDRESYVAGAAPLNRNAPRYSGGIDVFHVREERVASAALGDAQTLTKAGYGVRWTRQLPLIYTAEITRHDGATCLEWVVDSDFRFFPVLPDETFGFVLHPVDLAMNKAMAAAGRREVRDIVDLVTVHETILPLGAVIWAAVEKSPGFTPEGLIAEVRRNSTRASSRPSFAPLSTMPKPLSRACRRTKPVCCFWKEARSCSPAPTAWKRIGPTPAVALGYGPAVPKSPPPCWNATTKNRQLNVQAVLPVLRSRRPSAYAFRFPHPAPGAVSPVAQTTFIRPDPAWLKTF